MEQENMHRGLAGMAGTAVAILLVAMHCLAQPLTARAEEHDWGRPPENDRMVELIETPEHSGWQHFLPGGGWELLGASDELAFLRYEQGIMGLDIHSGEERWRHGRQYWSGRIQLLGEDFLVVNDDDGLLALDQADGGTRWEAAGMDIAGGLGPAVWLLRQSQSYSHSEPLYDGLSLVNALNGEQLWQSDLDPFSAHSGIDAQLKYHQAAVQALAMPLALAIGNELHCYGRDGLLWTHPLENPLLTVELHHLPQGIMLCEKPDPGPFKALTWREGPRGEKARSDLRELQALDADLSLSLLSSDDGRQLWQRSLDWPQEGFSHADCITAGANYSRLNFPLESRSDAGYTINPDCPCSTIPPARPSVHVP